MPENARDQISEFQVGLAEIQTARIQADHLNFSLMAKGMAMQQAGVIPMDMDPESVGQRILEIDLDSLRLSRH